MTSQTEARVLHAVPNAYVGTDAALVATNAEVIIEQGTDDFPLRVVFTDGLKRRCLHTDPVTALALLKALDDVVTACANCGAALASADAPVCVVSQLTICPSCRESNCTGEWHSECWPGGI